MVSRAPPQVARQSSASICVHSLATEATSTAILSLWHPDVSDGGRRLAAGRAPRTAKTACRLGRIRAELGGGWARFGRRWCQSARSWEEKRTQLVLIRA